MEPTAFGTDLRGFAVSAATSPAFSEPDMAKMQVGMTDKKPLKPLMKGVEFQYLKPIADALGAPPSGMTMQERITTKIQPNLIIEQMTSISPKTVTAPILMQMMTIQKIVIQAAVGTEFVQNPRTVTTP